MKILVTGASGFIGRHCVRLLVDRGHEVHAVSRRQPEPSDSDVTWHSADLTSPGTARQLAAAVRPSHLLHLAWCTEHGAFWTAPANLDWVASTLELARGAVEAGARRIVWAGTCAEYDWSEAASPWAEHQAALRPATLYGAAKCALGDLLPRFCAQTQVSHAWGRVFFAYGPGEQATRLVPSMIRALLSGAPARVSHSSLVRDLLYVEDVASAFVALVEGTACGPVNIASGQGTRLGDLASELARQLGRPSLVELGELPPGPGVPDVIIGANERLVRELAWTQSCDLRTGLQRSVEYWRHEADD